MPHVEPKALATVINVPRDDVIHSAVFACSLARQDADEQRPVRAKFSSEKLGSELLHGVAAQDAFVALFDAFDDFDSMAHEAVTAAVDETADPPA